MPATHSLEFVALSLFPVLIAEVHSDVDVDVGDSAGNLNAPGPGVTGVNGSISSSSVVSLEMR